MGNSGLRPGLTGRWGPQSSGHLHLLPSERTLLTAARTVLLLLEWTWQDGLLPSTWLRAQDAGSEPPRGACSGSRVTVIQYLSVCVDNQRINDSCFLPSSLFRE